MYAYIHIYISALFLWGVFVGGRVRRSANTNIKHLKEPHFLIYLMKFLDLLISHFPFIPEIKLTNRFVLLNNGLSSCKCS